MMKKLLPLMFFLTVASGAPTWSVAQQVADSSFAPPIPRPAYPKGRGPVVLLDEAHYNFHTAEGRYMPFAQLLRRDGYVVMASTSPFSKDELQKGKILVVANALAERNRTDWSLPTPSAFSDEEIVAVREWVEGGGSLFLIADHMPFAGAADKLATALGIHFSNGYAVAENAQGRMMFRRSDGSLLDCAITRGRTRAERIDSVATFTGSAFEVLEAVQPVLVLGPSVASILTSVAGQVSADTPRIPVGGWYQGATIRFGKGRVAVFGEAAMFSAQLAGPDRVPMGMNSPAAAQNAQFLLNVMRWLSGKLKDSKS